MVESMQQSSATPSLHLVFLGLRKIVACSQPYLAVASCTYSFWHGVIPTSYFIFNDFYTCVYRDEPDLLRPPYKQKACYLQNTAFLSHFSTHPWPSSVSIPSNTHKLALIHRQMCTWKSAKLRFSPSSSSFSTTYCNAGATTGNDFYTMTHSFSSCMIL